MVSEAYVEPIPSRRSARSVGRSLGGLTTSLGVHVAAALSFGAFSALGWIDANQPPPVLEQDVDVVPISSKDWERNLAADSLPLPSTSTIAHRKEASNTPLPAGQVVDVAAGNDEKPADAKYLSEHDNSIAKETRAREQTPFYGKAMPRQTTVHGSDSKEQDNRIKGNQGTGTDDATKSEKTQIAERDIPKTLLPSKVATLERSEDGETLARGDSPNTNGNSNHLQVKPGTLAAQDPHPGSEGTAGVPDAPNLPGSAGVPGTTVGAAPNDFLQSVPIGDGTFLNTREFKYASFFNRVKQRVGEQWRPSDELRRKDPRGHATSHSRITVVDVTLDDEGRVSDIRVSQSCGIDFLDEEAVAAFERAQPFPNPPTGLFDEDRHVRFRFGFHLDNQPGNPLPIRSPRGHW